MQDVIIVGAGPAGLSAALLLGRCARRVLLCDSKRPRNARSKALHGFLTRDGIAPLELRRIGRRELQRYPTVTYRRGTVTGVERKAGRYLVRFLDGPRAESPFLVLATGVVDSLPDIDGFRRLYARGIFHCPYCDGWEQRGRRLAAYGRRAGALKLALALRTWSRDVVLLTDGPPRMSAASLARLRRHRVPIRSERIARLVGRGRLERVEFHGGPSLARDAIFFQDPKIQRSTLGASLGCRFTRQGAICVRKFEHAGPPGLFVIGDASVGTQMAINAAAEGVRAAVAINEALVARRFP